MTVHACIQIIWQNNVTVSTSEFVYISLIRIKIYLCIHTKCFFFVSPTGLLSHPVCSLSHFPISGRGQKQQPRLPLYPYLNHHYSNFWYPTPSLPQPFITARPWQPYWKRPKLNLGLRPPYAALQWPRGDWILTVRILTKEFTSQIVPCWTVRILTVRKIPEKRFKYLRLKFNHPDEGDRRNNGKLRNHHRVLMTPQPPTPMQKIGS